MPNNNPFPATIFRALHETGCFILPNPWDVGSARILHSLGFKALASTSAGFAFTQGLPDSMSALSLDQVLSHLRGLVSATPLPVNADFQSGYGETPEAVAANVTRCIQTGVAGLSIEDSTGDPASPLFERTSAIERVKAARKAIDDSGSGVVLTARCEACLVGLKDWERVVFDRLSAYVAAGADCLYAPGVKDRETIGRIVKELAPKPVNVLVSAPAPGLSFHALAELGVRRISVGSALARVALGAFITASEQIALTGEFESLAGAVPFQKLNDLFKR
jgi:2-methylisocitrate lyase-like PEP mutase family enzyme